MTWTKIEVILDSRATWPGGHAGGGQGNWFDPLTSTSFSSVMETPEFLGIPPLTVTIGATWSNDTLSWAQFSAITDDLGGVDFELRLSKQFPMRISDTRSLPLYTSILEP